MESVQEKDVDPRVDLAIERTELALERTQLAWVRTSLALLERSQLPGLGLSALGMLLMLISSIQYRRRSRELKQMRGFALRWHDAAMFSSLVTLALGAVVLVVLWMNRN